jgi:acyl-CoA reductase-like NAD-dependent aldehyde dehydrogenase
MGKPLPEATGECLRAVSIMRYFASESWAPSGERYASEGGDTWLFTQRRPVGVVALITPWNFPAAIPTWKLAPALIFGNTVVFKPAEDAPLTGLLLVRALEEAGLPPGVLNAVVGPGAVVGAALCEHEGVDAISFTGSSEVGRSILAAAATRATRVQLEMGGHCPVIVREDAELDSAVAAVALGAFASAGQKCTSTRRVYVASPVYERFVECLVERAAALRVANGLEEGCEMGPLVNVRALEQVLEAVGSAASDSVLEYGGRRLGGNGFARGAFMSPTVLSGLPDSAAFARREVFGPAVAVWPVASDEDAIARANDSDYGLAASIFTRDLDAAKAFVDEIRVGLVHVNSQTAGAEVHVPFGGIAGSGYGPHEQGRAAVEFFTEGQTVYLDSAG